VYGEGGDASWWVLGSSYEEEKRWVMGSGYEEEKRWVT
jgi:hypothetical protein